MAKRKTYTQEYKIDAVKQVTDCGLSVTQVANSFGIHRKMLERWIRELTTNPEEAFPGKGKLTSEAEIIRQLKRENERLKMEREILKKAMAIFSKDPN